jgi:hypothetical protein
MSAIGAVFDLVLHEGLITKAKNTLTASVDLILVVCAANGQFNAISHSGLVCLVEEVFS